MTPAPSWTNPELQREPDPAIDPAECTSPDGLTCLGYLREAIEPGGWFFKAWETLMLKRARHPHIPWTDDERSFLEFLGFDEIIPEQRQQLIRHAARAASIVESQRDYLEAMGRGDERGALAAETRLRRVAALAPFGRPRRGDARSTEVSEGERKIAGLRAREAFIRGAVELHSIEKRGVGERIEGGRIIEKARVEEVRCPPREDDERVIRICEQLPSGHPAVPFRNSRGKRSVERTAWATYCHELRSELPGIERDLEQAEQDLKFARAEYADYVEVKSAIYIPVEELTEAR